jgi:type 1 fimbria pilin
LPIGTYGTVTLLAPDDSSAGQVVAMRVVVSAPINVLVNTCAVTSDTRVDVGSFTDTAFDTKSTGPKVSFDLSLNCPSASAVSITFDGDAPFGSAVSGLVSNDGSAKNIAVQLLDSGGVSGVKLAKKYSLGTVTGAKTLKYYARAYRLGTQSVTAGDIDAFVVFTLDVQ